VGIYHAAYSRGTGLNIVVAIDQVRDLMTTLQRSPRKRTASPSTLDGPARAQLLALAGASPDPFFSLGALTSEIRPRPDGRLIFEIFPREFPARVSPLLVVEDLPSAAAGTFGSVGRLWAGNGAGLRSLDRSTLDAETQAGIGRILDALRSDALATLQCRASEEAARASKERFQEAARLRRSLDKTIASRQDLADLAGDLAARLGPKPTEPTVALALALVDPPAPPTIADPPALAAGTSPPPVGPARPPVAPVTTPTNEPAAPRP
jgi:serine protease Do